MIESWKLYKELYEEQIMLNSNVREWCPTLQRRESLKNPILGSDCYDLQAILYITSNASNCALCDSK